MLHLWTDNIQVEFENRKEILMSEYFLRPNNLDVQTVKFLNSSMNGMLYILI